MSVAAMVIIPENMVNKLLYIPIATERFFIKCWMPAINALELKWIACFQCGIEITKKDLPFVIDELEKIKPWISENLSYEETNFMTSRIDNLIDNLGEIFCNDDVIVFIG